MYVSVAYFSLRDGGAGTTLDPPPFSDEFGTVHGGTIRYIAAIFTHNCMDIELNNLSAVFAKHTGRLIIVGAY